MGPFGKGSPNFCVSFWRNSKEDISLIEIKVEQINQLDIHLQANFYQISDIENERLVLSGHVFDNANMGKWSLQCQLKSNL